MTSIKHRTAALLLATLLAVAGAFAVSAVATTHEAHVVAQTSNASSG